MAGHIVTAPLVVAKGIDGADLYLYSGAPVPELFAGEVDRLIDGGFISEIPDASEETEDDGDNDGVYKGVSVKDLKATIAERNKDREDAAKVVPAAPGHRPELVAALLADDVTNA